MLEFLKKMRPLRKMRIVSNGHPALRLVSEPIGEITPEIQELAQRMIVTMLEGEVAGVGLAAPQVGVNKRLIVIKTTPDNGQSRPDALPGELLLDPMMPLALVNPKIIFSSPETAEREEGCLSLPGVWGKVTRPAKVVLQAQTLDGQVLTAECGGLLACCLQHEIDHLDGVLFYDHLSPQDQAKNAILMKKMEKREQAHLK